MITKIQTIEQLKSLFLEIMINKTDKISDVSDNSILNATAYGVSKVAQKCIKDIAVVESHIFPDSATGQYLDNAATLYGVTPRYNTASKSSTFLRIAAEPGTVYTAGTHVFNNYNGVQFELVENVTIPALGWDYAKVRSVSSGSKMNVEPNTIIFVSPIPVGHIGCTNEYKSTGGLDVETDELLRLRIKKHVNILSRNTVDYYTEIFRLYNSDVLSVINLGNSEDGKRQLAIVLQNGVSLTEEELGSLLDSTINYFSITDVNLFGQDIGIKLVNVEWEYVDLDFRVQIASNYDTDEVRKKIQVNLTKSIDFRFWKRGSKVEWDDLLQVVKTTEGVKYVPDVHFLPAVDINVPVYKLPRIRGFIMRDLDGNIIPDSNNTILPIYYPI